MANLQNFVFFDGSQSTEMESNVLALMPTVGAIMLHVEANDGSDPSLLNIDFSLYVSSDVELTRKGYDNYTILSSASLVDFSTGDKITKPGLYMFVLPSATRVKAISNIAIDTKLKVFATVIE